MGIIVDDRGTDCIEGNRNYTNNDTDENNHVHIEHEMNGEEGNIMEVIADDRDTMNDSMDIEESQENDNEGSPGQKNKSRKRVVNKKNWKSEVRKKKKKAK